MSRFGRSFPVPWHQPRVSNYPTAFSASGSITVTGSATFVLTLPFSASGTVGVNGSATFTPTPGPTPIASQPTPDVWIAFNPTASGTTLTTANSQPLPATGQSNAYWTNVTPHVRDLQSHTGRQHFLERMEAGTCTFTLDGRFGYFLNGTSAGNNSGYVIQPRLPMAVCGTWSGTTYNLWRGVTDSVTDQATDFQNVDHVVQASDLTKYLSLMTLNKPHFYSTYAKSAAATNWYRCSLDTASTITLPDQINSNNGTYKGYTGGVLVNQASAVSFPNYGALIYDYDTCVDLTNGTQTPTGVIQLPQTSYTGLDFWFLGAGTNGKTIAVGSFVSGGVSYQAILNVFGHTTNVAVTPAAGGSTTNYEVTGAAQPVDDGYWHHIGWYVNGNNLYVYQDGVSQYIAPLDNGLRFISGNTPGVVIGADINNSVQLPAFIDEIVVSGQGGSGYTQPAVTEITNRYIAGQILQHGYPKYTVYSGDRIAEILVLAGYGSITGGAISLTANTFYINGAVYGTYGSSSNGFIQVEPYYWDSPIMANSALDLILQVCDTDVGVFYQATDGTLRFNNQNYYGSWAWNSSTNTGTWTPSYTPPAGAHVWSDDDSTNYAYLPTSLQVVRDDADVWTTVKITPQAGVDQVANTTSAEARWGYTTLVKSGTVHPSLNLALSTANYLAYLFRSPLPRVQSVEFTSATRNGGINALLLGTKIGDVVTFKRTAPNASTSGSYPDAKGQIAADMVVESVSLDWQAATGELRATYILDPYPVRT